MEWLKKFGLVASVGLPFGFPFGWMACNLSHGEYKLALSNLGVTIALGSFLIWGRYREHQRSHGETLP